MEFSRRHAIKYKRIRKGSFVIGLRFLLIVSLTVGYTSPLVCCTNAGGNVRSLLEYLPLNSNVWYLSPSFYGRFTDFGFEIRIT